MSLPIYNKSQTLKWVFLDLDDTLWDFSANSLSALKKLYINHNYLSKYYPSFELFSDRYHEINARMWRLYERAEIDVATLKRQRFALLFPDIADTEEGGLLGKSLNDEYIRILGGEKILVPGAEELCRSLSKHYLIGILSNGFREVQYRKLYGGPLWRYVQRMVLSDEAGISKPDERLFRFAERAVGAEASEIVMVGDNPSADIVGAVGAGWGAIYFDRHGRGDAPEGVPTASTLDEVRRLLTD